MDDSALKIQLAQLGSHRHILENWLLFWTWLVIIGVACELVFIIWDHKEEWREWVHAQSSGVIPFPSKPSLVKLICEILSVVLVVAGVSGELVVESKLGTLETNVQETNEGLVSNANQRTSAADLKRVHLENRIADIFGPRYLTPKQSARIAEKLKAVGWLKGVKVDVYIYAVSNPYSLADFEESRSVAVAIVHTLRMGRLDADGWLLRSCWGASASNVVVTSTDEGNRANNLVVGTELIKAFQPKIGTDPNVEEHIFPPAWCQGTPSDLDKAHPSHRKNDATVTIVVGRKVQPILTREMLEPSATP